MHVTAGEAVLNERFKEPGVKQPSSLVEVKGEGTDGAYRSELPSLKWSIGTQGRPPSLQPALSCFDACCSPSATNMVRGALPTSLRSP